MKTYNQVLDQIKTIAENHEQINFYGEGDLWEIATSGTINYPVFWAQTITSELENGQIGYGFTFLCMDIVQTGEGNESDVLSDTLQVLTDVISNLKWGNIDEIDIDDVVFSPTPFTDRFTDQVSGWSIDVMIRTPFKWNKCEIPTIT